MEDYLMDQDSLNIEELKELREKFKSQGKFSEVRDINSVLRYITLARFDEAKELIKEIINREESVKKSNKTKKSKEIMEKIIEEDNKENSMKGGD